MLNLGGIIRYYRMLGGIHVQIVESTFYETTCSPIFEKFPIASVYGSKNIVPQIALSDDPFLFLYTDC